MSDVLLTTVARLLLAPLLIIAAALLVKGYGAVGDGFAAGVIASLAVVIQYVTLGPDRTRRWLPVRLAPRLAAAGMVAVLAVAAQSVVRGEAPLTHAPPPGEDPLTLGTLELTTALAFDVGIFMLVLGAVVSVMDSVARAEESR